MNDANVVPAPIAIRSLTGLFCLLALPLHAATVTWDGGGDGTSWHDPLNWSGDTLPGGSDDVTISLPGAAVRHQLTTANTTIASLNCSQELSLTFGSLTVSGAATFPGGTLRVLGGTFGGSPQIIAGKLEPRNPGAPITFELFGASELVGQVGEFATVRVQGSFAHGEGQVNWTGLQNLHGELRLESPSNPVRARVRTVSADGLRHGFIYVQPTGRLTAAQGAGGERLIASELHLRGRVGVTGGATLRQAPDLASVTYTQFDGALVETDATSTFQLGSGLADIGGGTINGRMVIPGAVVATRGAATGTSPLILAGRVRLREHSAANLTLLVQGSSQFGDATLQANQDELQPGETWPVVPVAGPIRFESIDLGYPSVADGTRGGFWIKPTGSLTFAPGSGGSRNFTEASILRNDGRVEVLPGTASILGNGHYSTDGGVTVGDFWARGSQIAFGNAPATATELIVLGSNNRLHPVTTAIPLNQTVRLRGDNTAGDAALLFPANLALHGRLVLDTRDLAYTTRATVAEGAVLHVRPGGLIEATSGSGGLRALNGAVLNEGSVTVAANRVLRQENSSPASFTQRAGNLTVEAGGRFEQRSGTFRHEGGTITGEVVVANGALDVAATATVPTTLVLAGQQSSLLGNASTATTVWLRGANDFGDAVLNLNGAVLNHGTLRMESRDLGYPSRIVCADGASLVNEGRLEVLAGSGGQRRFEGSLVHRGDIVVAPDHGMEFLGSVEVDGGYITGPHDLFNIALRLTAAPSVPSTYRLVGQSGQLLTDIPPGMHLQLLGDHRYGDAHLTAPADVINRGRLELVSASLGYTERLTLTTGTFLNAAGGTLEFATGTGGRRHLEAPLDNRGSVIIGSGVELYLGRGSGTSRNRGTLMGGEAAVQVTGPFVNEAGATASFAGILRANDGCINEGTFQVGGTGVAAALAVYGPFNQGAAARLELDVLGTTPAAGYDRLLLYDAPVNLAGTLALNTTGFTPAAGAQFDVLGTQLPYAGTFQPVTGLALGADLAFNTDYGATLLRLTAVERSPDLTAPQITQQPLPRFAAPGESASFSITATGSEPLGYQWFRNGMLLEGQTANTLTIPSVGGGDFASYSCRIGNAAGSVTSASAALEAPGPIVPVADAVRTTLPPVEGDGVLVELFNGVGGGAAPTSAALTGLSPSGSVFVPQMDFPHPGAAVNVGGQFELFFADTAMPPAEVLGLTAANFTLRQQFLLRVSPDLDLDADRPGIQLTLGVGSDDGFHLEAGSQTLGSAGDRGFTHSWLNVTFEDRGLYPVTLLYAANAEGQSGLEFAWKTAAAPAGEIVPQAALYSSPDIGDRRVSFEEFPAGTTVEKQFLKEGVVFATSPGLVITDARPDRFVPVSGDRVLGDPAPAGASPGTVELIFVDPATGSHGVTDFVRFFVVDAEATGATVTALDPDGAALSTRELHGGAGTQERVLLRHANIARVRVTLGSGSDTAALDSLVFTTPKAYNRTPTLAPLTDATLDEGQTLVFTAQGSDPDGDTLIYGLVPPAPTGAAINPTNGVFRWTPDESQGPATVPVSVSVRDNQTPAGTATRTFHVTVREVNQPPVFPPIPELAFDTLGRISFNVGAHDPDLPANLTYRLELDKSLHLRTNNAALDNDGVFSWFIPDEASAGIYRGRVFVSDGEFETNQPFAIRLVLIPDLMITRLEPPAEVATLEFAPVTVRIQNAGSESVGNTTAKLWASSDDTLSANDLELAAIDVPALLPGASAERVVNVRWPNVTGTFRLFAAADVSGIVVEKSEANNLLASVGKVTVLPAYTATVATAVEQAVAGTPVPLTGTARKRDGSPAAAEVVSVHLRVRDMTRTLGALTDASGRFEILFRPLPGEAGNYSAGATHPGVTGFVEQDRFRLVGLALEPAALSLNLPAQRTTTNWLSLRNLSEIPLTGLVADVATASAEVGLALGLPATLAPDATMEIPLVLTSHAATASAHSVAVTVRSLEGATATLALELRVAPLRPVLVTEPASLAATVVRGEQALVRFRVRNDGSQDSPALELSLPGIPWLSSVTPTPLPALPVGAETEVELALQPPATEPIGDTDGTLVVGGPAAAVAVPFTFRVRADRLGSLTVEAVDEYTFYAAGAPRLTNVPVVLRDRLGGFEIARTNTDSQGRATFSGLAEGTYDLGVTADRHETFQESVQIIAGENREVQAFLARHNVEYRFRVEETGLADRTRITVETVFETRAPIPVLCLEPAYVDLSKYAGRGGYIEFKICNKGVLAAQNLTFNWPKGGPFVFKPLVKNLGDLAGQDCITVPVRILHDADRDGKQDRPTRPRDPSDPDDPGTDPANDPTEGESTGEKEDEALGRAACPGSPSACFTLECGDKVREFCVSGISPSSCGAPAGIYVSPLEGSGEVRHSSSLIVASEPGACNPCLEEILLSSAGECVVNLLSPGAFNCAAALAKARQTQGFLDFAAAGGKCALASPFFPDIPLVKPTRFGAAAKCARDFACVCGNQDACKIPVTAGELFDFLKEYLAEQLAEGSPGRAKRSAVEPGAHDIFPGQIEMTEQAARLFAVAIALNSHWGDDEFAFVGPDERFDRLATHYLKAIDPGGPGGLTITPEEAAGYRAQLERDGPPEGISESQARAVVPRWNRTVEYYSRGWLSIGDLPPGTDPDFIEESFFRLRQDLLAMAFQLWDLDNAADPGVAVIAAVNQLRANAREAANTAGICARVRLRLSQDAVQTRQAFTATLELDNNDSEPITALGVTLDLRDLAGQPVGNGQFAILTPELNGLSGIAGAGELAGGATGKATWTVVPSHDAAPTNTPVRYTLGATLVYQQGGNTLTIPLTPATITVLPQPRLRVAYFHERDVFADDPFTEPVEPSLPYSLAVRVENRGFGTARALRLESGQPRIIENDKGLLVDFNLFATEVAGIGVTPSLTAEFGDLAPGASKTARWLFRSTLQGQFVDYSATFQHTGPLSGLPEFSLVDATEIHELIHLVRVEGSEDDGALDFLVNDLIDDDFLPDVVHFSQGGTNRVRTVRLASFDGAPSAGDREVAFTAEIPAGFVYFRIPDPGAGQWRIGSLRRADGSEVAAANVWQTDRTFVAGSRRPRYENNLHIFDRMQGAGTVSYRLNYAPGATVAVPDSVVRPAGECLFIPTRELLANDTSASGRLRLIEAKAGDGAASGTVTLISGGVRYVPSPAGDADDAFTYTVQDAAGGIASTTVTVRVGPPVVPATNEVIARDDGCGPIVLLYRGEAGQRYAVESCDDLGNPAWQRVAEAPADFLGLVRLDLPEAAPEAGQRFYRVSGPLAP